MRSCHGRWAPTSPRPSTPTTAPSVEPPGARSGASWGERLSPSRSWAGSRSAIGALAKSTEGTGITKEDLARIRTEIAEGNSALFPVTEGGDLDQLGERFRGGGSTLLTTNLTDAEREVLLETFGGL